MSVLGQVFCKPAASIKVTAKIAIGSVASWTAQWRRPGFPIEIIPAMYGIGCGIVEAGSHSQTTCEFFISGIQNHIY